MAPKKAKSAFQFYQSEKLGEVKRELGPAATMGDAMAAISTRWKTMGDEGQQVYIDKEQKDRNRFLRESAEADKKAIAIQQERRDNLIAQKDEDVSKRGARVKVATERAKEENFKHKRKLERFAEMDEDELAERQRRKALKKAQTAERQRKRDKEEKALKDRHKKLHKAAASKSGTRLEYLLKQSSIFSKLSRGPSHADAAQSPDGVKHVREAKASSNNSETESADDEENADEDHIFLTKQPPSIVFGTMKTYQVEGLNWMIHLAEKGLNGILADEMGLGKTLQSISILAYNYDFLQNQGPHLICVPKSTLSNWMNELKRWCPNLRAIRFHGSKEDRQLFTEQYFTIQAAAHDGKRPTKRIKNPETGELMDDNSRNPRLFDVCVTTYEICNLEHKALSRFPWKYLVIDEAHRLKNESSIFSQTVRTFHTAHRLLLTGTPLQNNLHELWALLNFILPDIFSSSDQFDEWFNLEIDDEEQKTQMISQLHKILRPFMLRRLKADVAKGLPPKTETLIMVGMSKTQKQLYKKLLLRDIENITGNNTGKNKTALLNIVMQLRKCCGHPYLFEGVEDRTLDPLGEHLVENCGKLCIMDKLMKKLKERGSRVLIFTQMTRILDILEDFMHMRGYKYCRIDGNTDYQDRESAIDDFNRENSEKFCFILSTRAGGLGINLQTADTCILYDSDWNPQADLQAQDRCHRLGQKKPVNVYRLVTENSVEEKIVERAQQKLKLDAMVVQQGRLKDKDKKVSKEQIMAAVRFGADSVFRSEESTITDDDIDVILERGAAKTKALAEKIQQADKGDLLDFRLDGGMSAQTFEGIDYSDRELRNQLKLLAADSMGKRERKPPAANYNPVITPKKSMMVNNQKIKLPRSLRLPRMEDHQFYNRDRLLELEKLEFQIYASMRELGQLPPRENIDKAQTLLPPELAQEKIDLLSEGFEHWTRSMYFQFVKAAAKYGRDDIASIATDLDLQIEVVQSYSQVFWEYGPTEVKPDEWERVKANVEKGELKIQKKRKLSTLLAKFVGTFDKPRQDMVFANKGTTHFSLEQDRALLIAVNNHGYGGWDSVREDLRQDAVLQFQHSVQGMNCDMINKRCDYRIRQMEKELELRERKLRKDRPVNVIAAENQLKSIQEIENWEIKVNKLQMRGDPMPSLNKLSNEAREIVEERMRDKEPWICRLREIEIQVRDCRVLAEQTKQSILRGDQYVNYSNITLKAGGPHTSGSNNQLMKDITIEDVINADILRIPECGECKFCLDTSTIRKLCVKRLAKRNQLLIAASTNSLLYSDDPDSKGSKSKKGKLSLKKNSIGFDPSNSISSKMMKSTNAVKKSTISSKKSPSSKSLLLKKATRPSIGEHNRGNPLGNKKMAVPEEVLPELCRRIGANGTHERMKLINEFVKDHPMTSIRQVTIKFSEVVTKDLPACISPPEKRSGRAFNFYLRPMYYYMLPEPERPDEWEKHMLEDEIRAKQQSKLKAQVVDFKESKIKALMDDAKSVSESKSSQISDNDSMSYATSFNHVNYDSIEGKERPIKKKKSSKKHH